MSFRNNELVNNMCKEVWKDIKGYEGHYQVSNLGRVKRLPKEVMQWNHQLQKEIPISYPKRYLKAEVVKEGYRRFTLSLGNKQERVQAHRLVAENFIPNPESKPQVHHINHITHDNRVENLMWVTAKENEHYKWKEKQAQFEAISPSGERTLWEVQSECARQLKLPRHGINRCLNGHYESFRGYTFKHITPTD